MKHEPRLLAERRTGAASVLLFLQILFLVVVCGLEWAAMPVQHAGSFPACAHAQLAPFGPSAQPGLRIRDAARSIAIEWSAPQRNGMD
ncbi:hypothetical protein X740_16440 [Mesorhizobium sp. LNHC221B00]|nr:hypothetical protein X740_16440 [Mesorhizobium sp. LNHC221B00]